MQIMRQQESCLSNILHSFPHQRIWACPLDLLYALLLSNYVRQDMAKEMYLKGHKSIGRVCDGFFLLWECSSTEVGLGQ